MATPPPGIESWRPGVVEWRWMRASTCVSSKSRSRGTEDGYPSLWLGIKGGASPPLVVEIEVKEVKEGWPVLQSSKLREMEVNGSCGRTALSKSS